MPSDRGLAPKQRRFIDEYLVDCNATRAYKVAGYRAKNNNVAGVEAHKLLKHPKVAALVAKRQQAVAAKLEVTAEWVAEQLVSNHRSAHRNKKHPDLHASNRALELLGKKLGLFVDKHEHDVKISYAGLVARAINAEGGK